MTQPRYSKEHRDRAVAEQRPLITFDIVYPKPASPKTPVEQRVGRGTHRVTIQGLLDEEGTSAIMSYLASCGYGTDGVSLIAQERRRQRLKWSADHDESEHADKSLQTAVTYILEGPIEDLEAPDWIIEYCEKHAGADNEIKLLGVAGALIAAEIDRLTRKRTQETKESDQ